MQRLVTLLFLLTISTSLCAQWFGLQVPGVPRTADGSLDMTAPTPRTAEGKVDFSGLWVPADASGSIFDTSKIRGWAIDVMAEQESTFFVKDPRFNCLPDGPPAYIAGISVGGMRRIIQHPEFIAVLNPDMTYRQIYMDGRELEEEPILPTWLGYSVGYWEGDTLVIESNGYNDKTWLTREGLPHTDQLHIIERYTRLDYGHIQLEISYNDPGTITQPVQASVDLENRAESGMLEVICNESETAQSHYTGELSQAEEKIVEVPVDILEQYVGKYQGIWLGSTITVEVTLEEGNLYLERTPRYSDTGGNTDSDTSLLVPQSENAFDSSFGLGWIFYADDNGEINSLSEVHVSGEWIFDRVP